MARNIVLVISRWEVSRDTLHDNNIAAARAVDRELNYNFGSDLGLFWPWKGF